MPHPVGVDQPGPGVLADPKHAAVDVGRHAGVHHRRRLAEPGGPVAADQSVIAADAAGADDDGACVKLEVPQHISGRGDAAVLSARGQHRSAHAGDPTIGDNEFVDAVARSIDQTSVGDGRPDDLFEWGHHSGPGPPGDVEARDGIAMSPRLPVAPLGPTDDGEPAHPHTVQPGPLLAGGELHISPSPLLRPIVLRPIESRGADPVLPGEVEAVADAHPALLG